ncbi:hypothetical protein Tco_1558889 [Tanacetum coccineum]
MVSKHPLWSAPNLPVVLMVVPNTPNGLQICSVEKYLSRVESSKDTDKDYRKLLVTDEMVKYVLEKLRKNWNFKDEIANVIFEDLWIKYEKDDKGKEKEAEHDQLMEKVNKDDKGKGKVHDLQNRVEKLEVDLARAEHDKGKGKVHDLEDVDLDDVDVDDLDLENRIKKLKVDFRRRLKAKKAKQAEHYQEVVQLSSDEGFFGDEDVVLFNDVNYPLTDAEIRMFKERPTRSIAPTRQVVSTSTRSRAPVAFTSNAQVASAPKGYRKIAMTGCVLGLRAPDDPNASSPSAPRKRKSNSS